MTQSLQITLLGSPQVMLDNRPISGFATAKTQALLFYLAVTAQPHSRDTLANLFWGDSTEQKAKKNLRDALSNLRKLVEPYLLITRQTAAFNRGSDYQLDVERFDHDLKDLAGPPDRLRAALELYRGEFLEGFYVRDAPAFEEWALTQREWLHGLAIRGLQTLSRHYAAQGDVGWDEARTYTTRLLTLEPWHEESHRQMMELLARTGQRGAALVQYETCRRILAEELGTEPMPETTALYERLKAADISPPHNLPSSTSLFVGREVEVNQLKRYLHRATTRLITISGPGGMGKTRLALQAALSEVNTFLHGTFFIPLASLPTADYLASTMAEALGLAFKSGQEPLTQLLNFLNGKEMLLILDNFEHLIKGVDVIIAILAQAPNVKLLVTSRERLNLHEEWVLELAGLAYPSEGDREIGVWGNGEDSQSVTSQQASVISNQSSPSIFHSPLSDLQPFPALTLFVERARHITPDFSLTEATLPHVVRLCQLVRGLPLGLELAASWLRLLTPAEIVAEIQRNLDFLKTSLRNVPERHRSLRAVFEHSWALLTTQEQVVYAKLSIFRGGFQREAAKQIASASLPLLASLTDKSLLYQVDAGRYALHELLRQYAAEKLKVQELEISQDQIVYNGDPVNIPSARLRHSLYFMRFLSSRDRALNGSQPQQAVAEIKTELDNIRHGWYWCVTNPVVWNWALTTESIVQIEQGIGSLTHFYDLTGLFQEGINGFQAAIEHIQMLLADGPAPMASTQHILSKLHTEQAHLLNQSGAPAQAIQAARTAAKLAETIHDVGLEAAARHQWGKALVGESHYKQGQDQLEQALSLARQVDLSRLEAKILRRLGIIASNQGNHLKAQELFERALMIVTQADNIRGQSLVLNNLGIVAKRQGDYAAAQTAYQAALRRFRQIEDAWGESLALNNLGTVAYARGRYSEAQRNYQQSLRLSHELEDRINKGIVLENLGALYIRLGAYARARDYCEQSLQLRRDMSDRFGQGEVLAELALLHHDLGDDEAAYTYSQQANHLAQKVGARSLQAKILTYAGQALAGLARYSEAVTVYQQALAWREQSGQLARTLHIRAGLAQAWLAQGELAQAGAQVDEIDRWLHEETLPNLEEPFRLCLMYYHILKSRQDERAATVLATAHNLLQTQAAQIEDETLRHSFLEKVAIHREIRQAFQSGR